MAPQSSGNEVPPVCRNGLMLIHSHFGFDSISKSTLNLYTVIKKNCTRRSHTANSTKDKLEHLQRYLWPKSVIRAARLLRIVCHICTGFYVCKLKKYSNAKKEDTEAVDEEDAEAEAEIEAEEGKEGETQAKVSKKNMGKRKAEEGRSSTTISCNWMACIYNMLDADLKRQS